MKLDRTAIAVSLTDDNRGFFKLLDNIRPNYISFSQFLGLAAKEYYENNSNNKIKITDFTNHNVSAMPSYYADVETWKKFILNMPNTDIKRFTKRLRQIDTILNKKVQEIIR